MIFGYARVSTAEQSLDAQKDALCAAGVESIYAEKVSAGASDRPKLAAMLEKLAAGDVVIVTRYDRLARSLKGLLEAVEAIEAAGAGFRSINENIDTTTSSGRLIFHVFASIAQFERELISERTKEALAAARKNGRIGGRRPVLSEEQKTEVRRMRSEGKSAAAIARLFKVSDRTIRRVCSS